MGKPKNIIKEHDNSITSLSLSSDNTRLISSSLDKRVIVFDISNLSQELLITDLKSEVLAAWFSYNDKLIFSAEKNKIFSYFNRKGELRYVEKKLSAHITCFVKMINKNKEYFAVGLFDGTVLIFNNEYNPHKKIPLYDEIKNKDKTETKDEEQYSVVSLTIDKNGEFLFIGYRNGIIMTFYLTEKILCDWKKFVCDNEEQNNIKSIFQNDHQINNILYEDKFFEYIFIGDNKGFRIKKIKGSIIFQDNSDACFSLCFDKNKNYLFACFGDGIIRVYHIIQND